MKRLLAVLACLVCLMATFPAHAIRMGEKALNVKIDFEFVAGDQTLPAGSYRVRHPTGDIALIELENSEGKKTVIVAVSRLARRPKGGTPTGLVFEKVGSQHVLSEVWLEDLDGFLMRHDDGTPAQEHGHEAAR